MGPARFELVPIGENSSVMVNMVLKCLVFVFSTFLVTTNARPEPPYYYPPPTLRATPQTFSAPTSQNFRQTQQTYTAQNFNNVPSTSYGTPFGRNTDIASSSSSSGIQQGYTGSDLPSRNYGSPDLKASHQAPSNRYIPQQEPISIQKHIYVHVAPPDVQEERQQRIQQQASRQKHYKIIFIKTPSYNPPAPYIAQQQALQEEKTLVYVLVKKPEEAPEVPAQQIAAAKLNKPEVYFIKYKSRSEQVNGDQNVQQQVENVHEDNESIAVDSAVGRGAGDGYNYDRPAGALN